MALATSIVSGTSNQMTRNAVHKRPLFDGFIQSLFASLSLTVIPHPGGTFYNDLQRDYGRDSFQQKKPLGEIKSLEETRDLALVSNVLSPTSKPSKSEIDDQITRITKMQKMLQQNLGTLQALLTKEA